MSKKLIPSSRLLGTITGKEQIHKVLNQPNWSIRELFNHDDKQEVKVDLDKFNKLSGLNLSGEEIEQALRKQIGFINSLQKFDIEKTTSTSASSPPLTYETLMKEIQDAKAEPSKGESTNSWDPMVLPEKKSDNYYVLQESLHKD